MEWDVLFTYPELEGRIIIFLGFRGGGLAQRFTLRLVLPVAHVLQEVYEVFGFPRPKGYMAKYSIIDAPTRRFWSWKIGTFLVQPDHCTYRAWVILCLKLRCITVAPYSIPFVANHYRFNCWFEGSEEKGM